MYKHRKKWASSSFSSSIIFWVDIRMSSQSQRERTNITGESTNHFRRNLLVLWPQNMKDFMIREFLPQFFSASPAWSLTPSILPPSQDIATNASPLSPFLIYLGPDLIWHCVAYTPLSIKYWNMFCQSLDLGISRICSSNFIFSNPAIMLLFPFLICSESNLSPMFNNLLLCFYRNLEPLHLILCSSLFYCTLYFPQVSNFPSSLPLPWSKCPKCCQQACFLRVNF